MTLTKNPLFAGDDNQKPDETPQKPAGYIMPGKKNRIEPLSDPEELRRALTTNTATDNPAVNLIKEKLARIYEDTEPDAQRELGEAAATPVRSPHQQFMYELSTSGKSLAEIQTEWHNYYVNLPDDQKHQVWQEFYDSNTAGHFYPTPATRTSRTSPQAAQPKAKKGESNVVVADHTPATPKPAKRKAEDPKAIKHRIRRHVEERAAKIPAKHRQNLHSLMFGLVTGLVVLFVFMFSFFNEVIIAPFMQPGRGSATPIIIDNNSIAAGGATKVIIPKINVDIPVVYGVGSNAESVIQQNLNDGTVHYPSTDLPGEKGNVAIFGHSSNNIFNEGKYKFAFVLLHRLQKDDTFYLTYNSKVYAYKVIVRKVVTPDQVEVLNDVPGQTATASLITCDPPGTNRNRLVVVGKQISPDPVSNIAGSGSTVSSNSSNIQLASNGPTLWSKFWNWLF